MEFKAYCAMAVGPREDQEDCLLINGDVIQEKQFADRRVFFSESMEMLAVCDGMGGLSAGEKASRFVCENLSGFTSRPSSVEDIYSRLEKIQQAMAADLSEECGTTVAGMLIAPSGIQVFNLGDSRVYKVADDGLQCLSHDHSVVQVLLDEGKITDAEAFAHPYRNLITAGMGPAFSYKWALETISLCDLPFETGGVYLLCSDGVCDVLTDREIAAALGDRPVENGPALMEAVKAVFMKDNTSFILVEITP